MNSKVENVVYKDSKEAHYAMWDWIAVQVKQAKDNDSKLSPMYLYKHLWLVEHGYNPDTILHDCFACDACEHNCNECSLFDILEGCLDIWINVVCKAYSDNDYNTAYNWAIKIRDGWK